jgi:hypothetical protein
MRWPALGLGVILIAGAFLTGARVADTREGLVYEVVTLLAGLAGVSLLLYGLVATLGRPQAGVPPPQIAAQPGEKVHNAGELVLGAFGLVVAAILIVGIGVSAGLLWALVGSVLLLPMIAGCAYLCFSFARGPRREWRVNVRQLLSRR